MLVANGLSKKEAWQGNLGMNTMHTMPHAEASRALSFGKWLVSNRTCFEMRLLSAGQLQVVSELKDELAASSTRQSICNIVFLR
jgi:hypothetical protein